MADAILPVLPLATTDVSLPPPSVSERHASARLPIELWREIFWHATHVVGGYETAYRSPFEFSEIDYGYCVFLKMLKEAHRVKQTLCLVSKTWRYLARELIFEYLFLQNTYDWTSLANALEDSKRKQQDRGGHGMGWYVKRIEIWTDCWTQEQGIAAARVVQCCPNLRVLTVGAADESVGVPIELIRAVFESCPRSIRSLDWTCEIGPDQTIEMFCLMQNANKLQSLFMVVQDHLDIKRLERFAEAGRISLPELHTIELVSPDFDPSTVLMLMASWDLPSLRQVVFNGQVEMSYAYHFFDSHGPKLTTLEFDNAGDPEEPPTTPASPSSSELPRQGPEMLFTRCPNITELILHVHWAGEQAQHGHAKVERIGLRGLHLRPQTRNRGGALALRAEYDDEQRAVLHALKSAFPVLIDRSRFPGIRAVRLLDFDQSRFRSIPWRAAGVAFWALWVKRFERLGIRLEDHAGDLIELVFREVNVLLPEDEQRYLLAAERNLQPTRGTNSE